MSDPAHPGDEATYDVDPIVIDDDNALSEFRLNTLQHLAIAALLPGTSLAEAASLCGVCRTTIWRWTKQPHFQEALHTAREEAFTKANANLKYISQEAVYVLGRNLQNGNPATEIRAAVAVLNQAYKSAALLQQERRLLTLERTLKDLNGKAGAGSPTEEAASVTAKTGVPGSDVDLDTESPIALLEV